MSATAPAVAPAIQVTSAPQDYTLAPLTVEQYRAMARAGILEEGAPIELLEGLLVSKMTKYPPHRVATQLLLDALRAALPQGWHVAVQEPVTLADSEPEPDLAVVRGGYRDYLEHHPGPADLALVVEVADATLTRDQVGKRRIYARAGIVVYWVVNLVDGQIEVSSDPSGPVERPSYRRQVTYLPGDELPVLVEGAEIGRLRVADLLP